MVGDRLTSLVGSGYSVWMRTASLVGRRSVTVELSTGIARDSNVDDHARAVAIQNAVTDSGLVLRPRC